MKDGHKVHKHRHRHEEHHHKKCRRKKEKCRNRSRSRSRVRSNSSSPLRSRSKSPYYSKSRFHRRSKSPEPVKTKRSPDRNRKDRHVHIKTEVERNNVGEQKPEIKVERQNDEEIPKRNAVRRREDEKPRWGRNEEKEDKKPIENKAKPDFGLSGKLAEEINTYKGVVIKYSEPPEARMPKRRWRLYPFKGDEPLPTLYIHRQSAYLIGRDRVVVDLPIDHPSCSKQHAVLQYRVVSYSRDDGTKGNRVRPYIIDLDSANGTFVNNKKIEARKFVELLEKDVIKFAFSSREYVVLHEHSKDDEEDDNVFE